MKFNELRGAYDSFWRRFLAICDHNSYAVQPRSFPFKLEINKNNKDIVELTLAELIHLINWPYRETASKNRKLDILIEAKETISLSSGIKGSNVKLTYYEIDSSNARPREAIHYDYQINPDENHPLFHAQVCSDILAINNKPSAFRKYTVNPKRIENRLNCIRIPSAHMSLVSVLVGLTADHCSPAALSEIINCIKEIPLLPKALSESLHKNIGKDDHAFRSYHWYAIDPN